MKKTITISLLLIAVAVSSYGQNTQHYSILEDDIPEKPCISKAIADSIFNYFSNNTLFIWNDHNNCEDRANAIYLLLDKWKIPNCKGWVISGSSLEKADKGLLKEGWGHHITAVVPVCTDGTTKFFVIDPATQKTAVLLEDWAASVLLKPNCYYFLKNGNCYDAKGYSKSMNKDSWNKQNESNYKFTIQGLTGVNGVGRWHRPKDWFMKKKFQETKSKFENLIKPSFIK